MQGRGGPLNPGREPARILSRRQVGLILTLVTAAVLIGATLFVVTLPPSLSIRESLTRADLLANFPTTNSGSPVLGSYSATTYANQSSGPSSTLTITVHVHAYAVALPSGLINNVQLVYDVAVSGKFAPNVRPTALQFACNLTGSNISVDFYNNWDQGANVSSDRQQTFGFIGTGSGELTAVLLNGGGPGPFYAFDYGSNGQSMMLYQYPEFIGFHATVTGWLLPAISAGIVLKIQNVPKRIVLDPAGTTFLTYGYNETEIDVSTIVPYTVTGAFTSSAPVTAYVLNLSQWWDWMGYGVPPDWTWRGPVGILNGTINVTLSPIDLYYLIFLKTPLPPPGPVSPMNVTATQDFVATT